MEQALVEHALERLHAEARSCVGCIGVGLDHVEQLSGRKGPGSGGVVVAMPGPAKSVVGCMVTVVLPRWWCWRTSLMCLIDGEGAAGPLTVSGCLPDSLSRSGGLQVVHVLRRERLPADPPFAAFDFFDRDPGDGAHRLALDLDHRVGQLLDHVSLLAGSKTPLISFTLTNGMVVLLGSVTVAVDGDGARLPSTCRPRDTPDNRPARTRRSARMVRCCRASP